MPGIIIGVSAPYYLPISIDLGFGIKKRPTLNLKMIRQIAIFEKFIAASFCLKLHIWIYHHQPWAWGSRFHVSNCVEGSIY